MDEKWVAVRVADTGRGIPGDEVANIFDRYYRVNRGGSGDAGSTGLGLAITRHIVDLHGGEIRVESDPARGTTFIFELPLSAAGGVNSAAGAALP
jgi:signal transduction histidine kinase